MTRRRVRESFITSAAGYLIGLLGLGVWPGRTTADQDAVLLVGIAIAVAAVVTIDTFVFRRPLVAELRRLRPLRYSWPNFVLPLTATMLAYAIRSSDLTDKGVVAYAVALPIVSAGSLAADLLWARGQESANRSAR